MRFSLRVPAAYPLWIEEGTSIDDGFVAGKFTPAAGKQDQAGGGIRRGQDADPRLTT